jgi:uncharacterized protein YjiS (DUF1127 family)
MASFTLFGRLLERRSRMQGYQAQRREIESLSDADLADIGVKRYQLGHVARVKTFK